MPSLVGSEMCIRDRLGVERRLVRHVRGLGCARKVDGQKFYDDQTSLVAAFTNITSQNMWKHTEYISAVCANAVSGWGIKLYKQEFSIRDVQILENSIIQAYLPEQSHCDAPALSRSPQMAEQG